MRISDWSSDVCSSDLLVAVHELRPAGVRVERAVFLLDLVLVGDAFDGRLAGRRVDDQRLACGRAGGVGGRSLRRGCGWIRLRVGNRGGGVFMRSEEHTSELQSLMRISYAVFFLKKKTQ